MWTSDSDSATVHGEVMTFFIEETHSSNVQINRSANFSWYCAQAGGIGVGITADGASLSSVDKPGDEKEGSEEAGARLVGKLPSRWTLIGSSFASGFPGNRVGCVPGRRKMLKMNLFNNYSFANIYFHFSRVQLLVLRHM